MSSKWVCLWCLLAGCLLVPHSPGSPSGPGPAQEPGATVPVSTPAALPSTETLPRTYPVLTIQQWCPGPAGKKIPAAPNCRKVVSRADFEELVDALNPKMGKAERRELVKTYGQVLALAQEAVRRGLDRKPRTQARLSYARLNILAHEMSQELYQEGGATSPEEVAKYYATHQAEFELFTVERISIPQEKQGQKLQSLDEAQPDTNPSRGEMKALAEEMHARALAGEDFAALQEKVFQAAGINAHPKVGMEIGRDSLPVSQQEILGLPPGKVSPLFADLSGYHIYKMVSRQVRPLDAIREQVEIRMRNQKTADLVSRIHQQAQAKVNDAYFDKYDPPPPDPNEPEVDAD